MKSFVSREILAPLATRVGTALAGYLMGKWGITLDVANEVGGVIGAGILVLPLVLADLVSAHLLKKPEAK